MVKNVLVGATQLDVAYNKVSLRTKFGRFSSVMTVVITKRLCEKGDSGAYNQVEIQDFCFSVSLIFMKIGYTKPLKMEILFFHCPRFLPGLWILKIHTHKKNKDNSRKAWSYNFKFS